MFSPFLKKIALWVKLLCLYRLVIIVIIDKENCICHRHRPIFLWSPDLAWVVSHLIWWLLSFHLKVNYSWRNFFEIIGCRRLLEEFSMGNSSILKLLICIFWIMRKKIEIESNYLIIDQFLLKFQFKSFWRNFKRFKEVQLNFYLRKNPKTSDFSTISSPNLFNMLFHQIKITSISPRKMRKNSFKVTWPDIRPKNQIVGY